MKELIDHAIEMIKNKFKESKLIHYVLTEWDNEMRQAFILAWRVLKDEK